MPIECVDLEALKATGDIPKITLNSSDIRAVFDPVVKKNPQHGRSTSHCSHLQKESPSEGKRTTTLASAKTSQWMTTPDGC